MLELYNEALAAYNLPATVLLGLVLIYWLMVILGISDGDTGAEAAFGNGESLSGTLSALSGGGGISKRLGIWPVPLSLFGSVFALFWWLLSVWLNHFVSKLAWARTWWLSAGLLLFTALVGYGLSVVLFRSLKFLTSGFQGFHGENTTLVGSIGVVLTAEITTDYGQVQVDAEGAPFLINARIPADATPILKGESVRLLSQHESGNFYYVQAISTHSSSSL